MFLPTQRGGCLMEEMQIEKFIYRTLDDEQLRIELADQPEAVIAREGFSPRVAAAILRLVPRVRAFNGGDTVERPAYDFWLFVALYKPA
jgi:hypothetical protein